MAGRAWRHLRRPRPPLVGRHPILDGPPTRQPRSGGVVAMLAVLALVLLVWVVSGGDPGSSTRTDDRYVDTGSAAASPTPDGATGGATGGVDPVSDLPLVALDDLPPEAGRTAALIAAGGPFPGSRDGAVFGNEAAILPEGGAGYYREYAVATPGGEGRSARRLVEGGGGELYWTDDRDTTFVAVAP